MKQILLKANNTYLFQLPKTYNLLIEETCKKTNIPEQNIILYHNGNILDKNNFYKLNQDINILDVSFKIKGGTEFPNLIYLFLNFIKLFNLNIVFLSILFAFQPLIEYIINPKSGVNIFDLIHFFSNEKILSYKTLTKEFLFISIIIFVFSTIPIFIIFKSKKEKCESFNPPMITLYGVFSLPFLLSIFICYLFKNDPNNNSLYILSGFIFIISAIIFIKKSINTLNDLDKENDNFQICYIPIIASITYIILKLIVLKTRNKDSGKFRDSLMIFTIFIITNLSIFSPFANNYMKYASGLTKC